MTTNRSDAAPGLKRLPSVAEIAEVAATMAEAGQPERGLVALDRLMAATLGHTLFTLLILDWDRQRTQRFYTNMPEAYPVGGHKPLVAEGPFHEQVVRAGRPRFCRNRDDIVAAFFDHELILSLGCESCVNMPVRWNGTTYGALNLLHVEGWYGEGDRPALSLFAGLAIPAVLEIVRAA